MGTFVPKIRALTSVDSDLGKNPSRKPSFVGIQVSYDDRDTRPVPLGRFNRFWPIHRSVRGEYYQPLPKKLRTLTSFTVRPAVAEPKSRQTPKNGARNQDLPIWGRLKAIRFI